MQACPARLRPSRDSKNTCFPMNSDIAPREVLYPRPPPDFAPRFVPSKLVARGAVPQVELLKANITSHPTSCIVVQHREMKAPELSWHRAKKPYMHISISSRVEQLSMKAYRHPGLTGDAPDSSEPFRRPFFGPFWEPFLKHLSMAIFNKTMPL